MNIFFLDADPVKSAAFMLDKHIVKMPLESAQMLSTAHRLLDGVPMKTSKKTFWLLPGEKLVPDGEKFTIEDRKCFQVAHAKHPSTVWTMLTKSNYLHHLEILKAMLAEYTLRYGKIHSVEKILPLLGNAPTNIPDGVITSKPLAMPDIYKTEDVVESYRRYYAGEKWRFAKWKNKEIPDWFPVYMSKVWGDSEYLNRLKQVCSLGAKKTKPMNKNILVIARELCHEHSDKVV